MDRASISRREVGDTPDVELALALQVLLAGRTARVQLMAHLICLGAIAETSPAHRELVLQRLHELQGVVAEGI